MLVLSRKRNEKIRIGDQITVTVVRLKGNRVRIGIEAPQQIQVLRGELAFELPEDAPIESHSKMAPADEPDQSAVPQSFGSNYFSSVAGLNTAGSVA
jgi:carbon storage regulator